MTSAQAFQLVDRIVSTVEMNRATTRQADRALGILATLVNEDNARKVAEAEKAKKKAEKTQAEKVAAGALAEAAPETPAPEEPTA